MPTVLKLRNIRVAVYTNDHPPAHVHVIRSDQSKAKLLLNCPDGPVRVIENSGFRAVEINEVGAAIAADLAAICATWSSVHGRV